MSYDDGGGDDDIDWPDGDAVLLPPATAPGSPLARAAAVSDAQRALVGQSFALPPDATSWKVADVFYSVEEGIDGVGVQYYDADRAAPTSAMSPYSSGTFGSPEVMGKPRPRPIAISDSQFPPKHAPILGCLDV